jgi:hypothetical protein
LADFCRQKIAHCLHQQWFKPSDPSGRRGIRNTVRQM